MGDRHPTIRRPVLSGLINLPSTEPAFTRRGWTSPVREESSWSLLEQLSTSSLAVGVTSTGLRPSRASPTDPRRSTAGARA